MTTLFRKAAPVHPVPAGISLFPFLTWIRQFSAASLRADLLAGLTGAFIVLPQGVSFAMIAGLPAQYGLYTAIVPPVIAALFGSSRHLVSGPTTAISIILFSTLSPLAEPGSADYIRLALTLTFMAGLFQLAFGLARLGTLINFVSHSVVVGFSAGAALLIATSQLKHALGVPVPSGSSFLTSWAFLLKSTGQIRYYEVSIALVALCCAIVVKRFKPKWPALLFALIAGSLFSLAANGQAHGVRFLGELNGRLPSLSTPDFTLDTLRTMAPGALAVAFLGLIEALSIARSIAVKSGQHINGSQEFIGQGLSNIAGSFFSGYASSGSFTRSGVNYDSGAVSPLASIFSALFLSVIALLVAPLTAYLPLSAMGGVILFVAFKLIDVHHIKEILKSSRPDTFVLAATFAGTLLFTIEFAIYAGVLLSMAIYLTRTSHPHVTPLVPDPLDDRRTLITAPENNSELCPQLSMVRIHGSLFFGAANHVAKTLENFDKEAPRHLLIVGYGINFIDVSGAMALVQEAQRRQKMGKSLHLCRINQDVRQFLVQGEFIQQVGEDHIFDRENQAISTIYEKLDRNVCLSCQSRIFSECQTL
ncbi:SulP family inorganic anion transporter [uncultured Desulfobacter sp.]|uniref:SulP family inorganic anion transporter n=1 Tax=uncultured Desulfobacter sp. TaxID=240139 RepID=UPI002AAB7CCF|nr:SulP family inorganic anion transporter [uncultured Desulfobacter sp.]